MPDISLSLRRIFLFTTAVSMVLPSLPHPALAQEATPPARVGQIADLTGSVSFNGSGSGGWAAASLNYPVSDGDSLYTQDAAQATVALDASKITLAGNTELQITQLDQNNFAATESQGEVFLSVTDLQPGQTFTITTPRGAASITQNGQYDLAAGDTSAPTVITVFQGAASITAPGATLQVPAGQAGVLSGTDQTTAQLGQAEPDAFANSLLTQAAPPPPPYVPPVAEQMTGTTELATYGSWDQSPQYGAVWYPRVGPGWAPYREGHWAFIAPWGWTWVENEPWGFAPFHYGRWVDEDNRWGWAPCPAYQGGDGPDYRPVYAPAVVSFFGLGVAVGITAAALSSGSIGWVPLGPNEPYYPSYHASPEYIRQINRVNVRNINTVNTTNNYHGNAAPGDFANRRAATFIPAADMSRGDPVARDGKPLPASAFADARPINPGFSSHAAAGGQPDFRLPTAAAPLANLHPGIAPRPTEFAERHTLPPAVISHQPATHFAGPQAATFRPPEAAGMTQSRPALEANPAYHAPDSLPATRLPTASEVHPQGEIAHPAAPQVFRPQTEAPPPPPLFHPQAEAPALPQVHYGQEPARPAPPVFNPQAEAPRPVAPQAFHPPVEAPRPPPPVFHPPAEAPRPAPPAFHPAAEAPHPAPPERPQPLQHQNP